MDVKEVIKLLNEDFAHEIEVVLIYVRNAFVMKECDPSRVTEAIGIDEMRHMNWLADLIVKRGGKPCMEHRELDFGGKDLKSMLTRQATLESWAVERYTKHIEAIGNADKEVAGVLKHILDEEKRHRKEFRERVEKIQDIP